MSRLRRSRSQTAIATRTQVNLHLSSALGYSLRNSFQVGTRATALIMKSIFETCRPRADVRSGTTKDDHFAADLAQVVNATAPPEYQDPALFFQHTYPTRGLKELLKAVCQRLSGSGGEVSSIIRLHTQYGGGKTHGLIALVHAARGMKGVENVAEFVNPSLVPRAEVKVAALDGENADPANGITLEGNLRAFSPWGELAYRLAGVNGYERVRESDVKHIAPGAETIRELFGGKPVLIMLDEVSVYLRKVERVHPGAAEQFTAFVHALFKAVSSSPNVALVYTLAIGKQDKAENAYKAEHERALIALSEAEVVAARNATQLNPTEEDETAAVLRRRLFESVDLSAAEGAIAAYAGTWKANQDSLPPSVFSPETREQFLKGYPLHPEVLELLTEKTSSLSTFHRIRGMIRLLARTVHVLWRDRPGDVFAIHPHHVDLSFEPIRSEITTRLGQGDLAPALKSDVAAVAGDEPSLAQMLDQKYCPGDVPIHSYIARTIFLHTLAFGEDLKGIHPDQLKYSICSPAVEPSFVEQARVRFITESLFLDDKPGVPMRFMVEPNLTQIIRKRMEAVDANEVRVVLTESIRSLFAFPSGPFTMIAFPAGAYEVPDDVADGKPALIVMGHEALAIPAEPKGLPPEIEDICKHKGTGEKLREYRNNLVIVACDERLRENMKERVRRRLGLFELRKPEHIRQLADYQQRKVNEDYEKLSLGVAEAILQCYRHLFYPSHMPMHGTTELVAHTVIEVAQASDSPGNGQQHVARILREQKKLISRGDAPDGPSFVRDQTPLKTKGEISTYELRNEFRKAPKLSIMITDEPLISCIRQGIQEGLFIYREGSQVWGKDDPAPAIHVTENAFVHTLADAKKKRLWPRAAPLQVRFAANPGRIAPGEAALLTVSVEGGIPPYTYACVEAALASAGTEETVLEAEVSPEESASYQIEVTDSRGARQSATATLLVGAAGGKPLPPPPPPVPPPPPPPPAPRELSAEGPLAQALTMIWEKARKGGHPRIDALTVKFYEAAGAWKAHQAMATAKNTKVVVQMNVDIQMPEVEVFRVEFEGSVERANGVKAFLDAQLRAADDSSFEVVYMMTFENGLQMAGEEPEKLAGQLTRYGAGEAFVEAQAAPQEAVL